MKQKVMQKEENFSEKKSIEEIYLNRSGTNYSQGGEKNNFWLIGLLVILVIAGVALGVWAYAQKMKESQPEEKPSIVTAAISVGKENVSQKENSEEKNTKEEENKKEESLEVSPEKINVSVLNAGAPAGSAGKAARLLQDNKYIKTQAGNAEGSYVGTTVYYLKEYKAAAEILLGVVKKEYPKANVKEALSDEEKSASIVVVLGK